MDIVGINQKDQVFHFMSMHFNCSILKEYEEWCLTSQLFLPLFVLRKQFSELLLLFFILVILLLPKEKKLTHQFPKMTKPNSTWQQLPSFSCKGAILLLFKLSI